VQLGHRLVECGEPGTPDPGELGQVSVGYLAMADDPRYGNTGVLDIVLTSSLVIALPRCATGRPVRALRTTSPGWPEPSPRRISPVTVWLSV
jgi:hypothetical protein